MRTGLTAVARAAALILTLALAALALPARGVAAVLVGGSEQAAISRAFDATAAHRRQVIVSIRASSASPSWAVVRSVTPARSGQTSSRATPIVLASTYYHRAGHHERPAPPPAAVKAELSRRFQVAVVYAGAGADAINYAQAYRSTCAGQGGFTDDQTATVTPMSWSIRYVVDLDQLLAATRGPQGTVLVANVAFDAAGSHVDAVETVTRTYQDVGCNANPTTLSCKTAFRPGGSDPGGQLSFTTRTGMRIGLPLTDTSQGTCSPSLYTLGPSLWDSGATAALVSRLGLLGGALPARPYAPIAVAWPSGSAQQSQGFAASPCQGDGAACTDSFTWRGTVSLHSVSAG